jgi:archaellin
VLVNTAGELQSRASDTGDDAQAQVSNQIDVVSATGETDGSSQVESVTLIVKKSPGSDPIDLNAATIQYTSASDSATLSESDSGVTIEGVETASDTTLDTNGERARITIDLTTATSALAEGEDAELEIVDQSGASTVYGVNVPDVISDAYVQV